MAGCDGECIHVGIVGDGFCDECTRDMARDGYCEDEEVTSELRFNCSALGYDGGDCLIDEGTGCWHGHELDCLGQCAPGFMFGDGDCDVEWEGFLLNCSATGWDKGDCLGAAL